MKIGYTRLFSPCLDGHEQKLLVQTSALKAYGCGVIFEEPVISRKAERSELKKMLSKLDRGDEVVIWKLDRLACSLKDVVQLVSTFHQQGVSFVSLEDNLNTSTEQGEMIFQVFISLSNFEREIIRERTQVGLQSARARGRIGGRPKGLSEQAHQKAVLAKELYKANQLSVMEICQQLSITKPTLYRYLKLN